MKNLQAIRRVLYITMGLNLIATLAKLVVGYWTNSLSLIADGFDSVFDSASNVIGLVGIYLASRPADEGHPYGHRKFETMTAVSISLLLFLTTWELGKSAVERLRNPDLITPTINVWSFGALLVSIIVHLVVVIYEYNEGKRLQSDVLVADAMHTQADIYISLSVIGGLIAVRLGYPIVDPLLALVIAVLIAKIGIDIIRESSTVLLDSAIVPAGEIERIVMGIRDVRACHHIRSRGHESAVYVDLHVQVDPQISTAHSHDIAHDVQHRLRAEIPTIQDVVVHIEPESEHRPSRAEVLPALRALADELGIAVHNINARRVQDRYHVELDMTADDTLPLEKAHALANRLEQAAHERIPTLAELTVHIEPSGPEQAYTTSVTAEQIKHAVQSQLERYGAPGVCHDLQVYPAGDGWECSLHCLLDAQMSLYDAHAFSEQLEGRLRDTIPRLNRVIIHTEPLNGLSDEQTDVHP